MTGRLAIEDVRPLVGGGNYPSKAVVGEYVPVAALIWREGHDAINATLNVQGPKGSEYAAGNHMVTMTRDFMDQDLMHASFVPDVAGEWTFQVDAWSDPMATWRHAVTAKIEAGQSPAELANDIEHGAQLFEKAAMGVKDKEARARLTDVAKTLRTDEPLRARVAPALSSEVMSILEAHPLRELLTRGKEHVVKVDRRDALVNSWYELFPRSTGGWDEEGNPVHGTFATTAKALDRVARMGFDTVYFPPIHPIGEINRKGKNNTLVTEDGDVGSPWAIGAETGGHDACHPELGTEKDFVALLERAKELDLEIALDLALQAAPDHPWAKQYPEFFTVLADGTIAFAENPPKKYQDIYPLNFDNNPKKIYEEIYRVVKHWVDLGVTTFRVDNPHTKPANFWEWLIAQIHKTNPEIIFLAEAFTRPARLYGLAKVGFSQSYTYFTWQTNKWELEQFATEIADKADVFRPNLFVNTPDILHASLQYGGRAMFAIRAALASTMSPLWGVYSGYELYEYEAVQHGSEEYKDSEKYELRPRDYEAALESGDSLEPYITTLNKIRRENPALQQLRFINFHHTTSDQILAYSKIDPVTGNAVLVVVNLDSNHAQEANVVLDLGAIGQNYDAQFQVKDLITGAEYTWGQNNFVRLDPHQDVAHIFQLPDVPEEMRERLTWRTTPNYHN